MTPRDTDVRSKTPEAPGWSRPARSNAESLPHAPADSDQPAVANTNVSYRRVRGSARGDDTAILVVEIAPTDLILAVPCRTLRLRCKLPLLNLLPDASAFRQTRIPNPYINSVVIRSRALLHLETLSAEELCKWAAPPCFRLPRHGGTLKSSVHHLDSCQKSPFSIAHPPGGIEGIFGGTFLVFPPEKPALEPYPNVFWRPGQLVTEIPGDSGSVRFRFCSTVVIGSKWSTLATAPLHSTSVFQCMQSSCAPR